MGRKPTAKQKAFTEAVVGGETHSAAYRGVYNAEASSKKTVWREAHRVANNPQVAPMIEAGVKSQQRELLRSLGKRREWIVGKLLQEAECGDNPSSRVRSLELLAKASGLFDHTEAERVESTTEADLIDMLQKRLVGIIPQPIEIEKIEVEEKDDPTPP
tara:strand:+ start:1240 stop:1716 length:477 start_codon:yes stop_codon:yes gene_type:complete